MFIPNSTFHVLYTSNIKSTHDFYKNIGAEIKEFAEDKVVVQLAEFSFHFILDSSEPFDEYKYIAQDNDFGNGIIFYIEVNNIQELYNLLTGLKAIIKTEIFDNKWDAKELLFEDPNGYKFAVYQINK